MLHDHLGTVKVRCGIGRSAYRVDPGLYAVGSPDSDSEVLVTSNYKLSFDVLRSCLGQKSFWVLVLDTDGVNVWCAAGKGTFGTEELIHRIISSRLNILVNHRRLIVPQLGAPGISSHEIRRRSGFKVIFGPVDCHDVVKFVDNGLKATSEMRFKSFSLSERAVLIPVEFFYSLKWGLLVSFIASTIIGLAGKNSFRENFIDHGVLFNVGLYGGIFSGAVVTPLLLPWLPGRSFSVKGVFTGVCLPLFCLLVFLYFLDAHYSWLDLISLICISASVSSYLSLNFTGSSTFTSLSGVRKEMKWAVPMQLLVLATGLMACALQMFLK